MSAPTPSLEAETETLREIYAAINRNDMPAMARAFDPQIVWIEPDYYPGGGTRRGIAEVTAVVSRGRGNWAEGSCEPEQFIAADEKIVVLVHVRVRGKGRTDWIDARLADVYTFRDGKAIHMRHFPDRRQALEWAGVSASDVS